MQKIRHLFIVLGMLLYSVTSSAQVSISIGLPHLSIGINLPAYPELVVVPGYPVYYAPRLEANYFFYDGMYWVYQDNEWYASSWYNGPWWLVNPYDVPLFILRIPVRYYRHPPPYFRGWRPDAPPRWGDHWGHDWERRRSGWERWHRGTAPAPAPLPLYQRQYSRDRYPRQVERQQELQKRDYRYQPRDPVVRQLYREPAARRAPAQQERHGVPEERGSRQQDIRRSPPQRQLGSAGPPRREGEDLRRPTPAYPQRERPTVQDHRQPPQPDQRKEHMQRSQGREEGRQGRDATREPKRGQEQGQGRGRDRDRDRNE